MIEVKNNRIKISDNATGDITFDTNNPMPHLLGSATWTGNIDTGEVPFQGNHYFPGQAAPVFLPGHWSSDYYWGYYDFDSEVIIPLGVLIGSADFLYGSINVSAITKRITTPYQGQYGTLLQYGTEFFELGKNYPIAGTTILTAIQYAPNYSDLAYMISVELFNNNGEASIKLNLSSKYHNHVIRGGGNSTNFEFAFNATIDLHWGKFPI